MEINREYLENKAIELNKQHEKIVKQVNNGIVLTQKLEGAIEIINGLLQELDKTEKINTVNKE